MNGGKCSKAPESLNRAFEMAKDKADHDIGGSGGAGIGITVGPNGQHISSQWKSFRKIIAEREQIAAAERRARNRLSLNHVPRRSQRRRERLRLDDVRRRPFYRPNNIGFNNRMLRNRRMGPPHMFNAMYLNYDDGKDDENDDNTKNVNAKIAKAKIEKTENEKAKNTKAKNKDEENGDNTKNVNAKLQKLKMKKPRELQTPRIKAKNIKAKNIKFKPRYENGVIKSA